MKILRKTAPGVKAPGPMGTAAVCQFTTIHEQICIKSLLKSLCGFGIAVLFAVSADGATRYVDNTASGANDGSSWQNAWTSMSAIQGLGPGDIVYISGGSVSQTYSMPNAWQPAGGTAASPVTYRIAQDGSHSGTVVFNGQNNSSFLGNISNVVLDGDYGGAQRFMVTNYSGYIVYAPSTANANVRLSHINFPSIAGAFYLGGTGWDLDGCYIYKRADMSATSSNLGYDCVFFLSYMNGNAFDANKFHNCSVFIPVRSTEGAYGDDGWKWGTAFSVYSNNITCYPGTYPGGQHADIFQTTASYCKVYANYFDGVGESVGYWDSFGSVSDQHYIYIYNNVFQNRSWQSGVSRGFDMQPEAAGAGSSFTHMYIANNTFIDFKYLFTVRVNNGRYTDVVIGNNILKNSSGLVLDPGVVSFNNANNAVFTSYTQFAANNGVLSPSDTFAKDLGSSFFAPYFNTDKNGVSRPQGAAWDIGAYEYTTGGASTNPVLFVTPGTLDFGPVLTNTTANLTMTVQNIGGGTLAGSISVSAPFQVISGGTFSLANNQSQTITLSFKPTTAGSINGTATLVGGGGFTAGLTGVGYIKQPGLSFNSIDGSIVAPFSTSGGVLSQTVNSGLSDGGMAVYGFNVSTSGSYVVSASVNAPDLTANSMFINIDGQPTDPDMIWDAPTTTGFVTQLASWRGNGSAETNQFIPKIFNLSSGTHSLIIRGREAGMQIGAISIVPYTSSTTIAPPIVSAISQNSADVDPNTAGLQIFAGSVIQYSGSASDPNGLPLTWQWVYSYNGSADAVWQSGTGAVASISVNYPSSVAGSTYVWKLRVSNGTYTSQSTLTVGVQAPPPPSGSLTFAATSGTLTAPFVSQNGYITQAAQTGLADGGRATYNFTITNGGSFVVQMLMNAPNDAANSLYYSIDTEPQDPGSIFDVPNTSGFEQRIASWRGNGTPTSNQFIPKTFDLTPGSHQLIVVGREAGVQIQALSVLKLPPAPQNLRIVVTN